MKRRTLGLACLLLAMLVGMTAWVSAQEPVTLIWSFWGDPNELPPNYQVIEAFEAAYPYIKIETQHAPWSSYFDRIQTQMAGGTAPDVMFLNNIPSYAARGALMPLDDLIAKSGFDIEPYYDELLKIFKYKDVIYGFPRDNDTTILYYNKDLFDAAGVDYPDGTWTWTEFLDAAQKLTVRDERGRITQYGVVLESNKYFNFIHQNGADIFDDNLNPTRFTLDDPKAIEALQFMGDLINKYEVAPSFAQMLQLGNSTELFQTGRVAMAMTNAARIPTFQQASFRWGVAPLPAGPTGIRANSMSGAGYVISANTKHPEEAWTFLQFLCGVEGQTIFASTGVAVPAYRSDQTRDAFVSALPEGFGEIFLEDTEYGKIPPLFDGWVELNTTVVNPALDLLFIGEATAEEVVAMMKPDVEEFLAKRNQ
ncbi:MAG: sugar ABC transporter substrate-binding protein [Firmicutes bacterium]|jgi:multiple sugar transport system substrate-binding protein|nr:sugar ABC transporter substrate-binding protein [Bacillota bacterium]